MLTEILRDGAQRLLSQAVEAEVDTWIESHKHLTDERGRRHVVRNGHLPKRGIITGVGSVEVTQPRVHDRRHRGAVDEDGRPVEPFRSKILPPYLRKTRSVEGLIPWLYLKGISTSDFTESLQSTGIATPPWITFPAAIRCTAGTPIGTISSPSLDRGRRPSRAPPARW